MQQLIVTNRLNRKVNLFKLTPGDFPIWELANAGAQINRYGGHLPYPNAVTTHSVLCSHLVPEKYAYDAITHDLTEMAGLNDLISKVKHACPDYAKLEDIVRDQLVEIFGFSRKQPSEVSRADKRASLIERAIIRGDEEALEKITDTEYAKGMEFLQEEMYWQDSRDLFLERFHECKKIRDRVN